MSDATEKSAANRKRSGSCWIHVFWKLGSYWWQVNGSYGIRLEQQYRRYTSPEQAERAARRAAARFGYMVSEVVTSDQQQEKPS